VDRLVGPIQVLEARGRLLSYLNEVLLGGHGLRILAGQRLCQGECLAQHPGRFFRPIPFLQQRRQLPGRHPVTGQGPKNRRVRASLRLQPGEDSPQFLDRVLSLPIGPEAPGKVPGEEGELAQQGVVVRMRLQGRAVEFHGLAN
jgi:hypothetical protein